jgi:hypothetical protein
MSSTSADSCKYAFNNLTPGRYIVHARLGHNSTFMNHYFPTYFGNVIFWNSAIKIQVPNGNNFANISLIPVLHHAGNCRISGRLLMGIRRVSSLEGYDVSLSDMNNNPLETATTDINGQFSFNTIIQGTYNVQVEITGKTSLPRGVIVSNANPIQDKVDFEVNSTFVLALSAKNLAENSEIGKIYPNPFNDRLVIEFKEQTNVKTTVQILDIAGRIIKSEIIGAGFIGNFAVQTADLQAGVYVLSIQKNGNKSNYRIIKEDK